MPSLFFSYSHRDEALRNELEEHLSLLKRQGIITAWHDRRIGAGENIHGAIDSHLEECEIVLLLVSAHFLASDYCYEKEMQRALERAKQGLCTVIPVILHPCDWISAPFGDLRATPADGKPVSMFANPAEALAIVAADVRKAAMRYMPPTEGRQSGKRPPESPSSREPMPRSSNLRVRRTFNDHERDAFLEESFEYIGRFFEGSLQELETRNPQIKGRFQRIDARAFSASIYENGKRVAQCSIWYGSQGFGKGIAYSSSGEVPRNSYNEMLRVEDDGYALYLKPLGFSGDGEKNFTQQGAAEHYWAMLIRPLQQH